MADINSTQVVSLDGSAGSRRPRLDVDSNGLPYELYISDGKTTQQPVVLDGIVWETTRQGSAGKLQFTVPKEGVQSFQEGNTVIFKVGGKGVFYGYVFKKERSKDNQIKVTAYDQLRYLKNKHTYIYTNKRADEVLKMIAADFNLEVGTIENTGYTIKQRIEDNQTLFDIIQNALDLTLMANGGNFTLYDDFGKLSLKNIVNSKTGYYLDNTVAQDFDYSSSIDNSYDKIQLYEDDDSGVRKFYIAQDGQNISNWGVLQLSEKLGEGESGADKAKKMLQLYNQKTRSLAVTGAIGDASVRAGSLIAVSLNLGDIIANSYMLVDKATHTFKNNEHTMNLAIRGGAIK